jgi:hypothetical protein
MLGGCLMPSDHVEINTDNLSKGASRLDPITEVLLNAGSRIHEQTTRAATGFGTGPVAEMLHTQLETGARQMGKSVVDLGGLTSQNKVTLSTAVKGYTATNDQNNSHVRPPSGKG